MPLVLSRRGRLVLHAGSVAGPEGAFGFVGKTGWGKSTLTASFCQQGFAGLADDCLLLVEDDGQFYAHPSYPGLRLWPDAALALFGNESRWRRLAHYTEKIRLELTGGQIPFCSDSTALRSIYVLASPEEMEAATVISIIPMSLRDAFMELVKCTYRLDVIDQERLKEEFERIGRLTASISLRRLSFPRRFSILPAVRNAILADVRDGIRSN